MIIQQIRNATLKIRYGAFTILLGPWLQDKGIGFSAEPVKEEMIGVKNPMNDLPLSPAEILNDVDFCLVTHIHPDHFTEDYLPNDIPVFLQNETDRRLAADMGFSNLTVFGEQDVKIGDITITKVPARHGDNRETVEYMGESSGYVLRGEARSLYIAGDTVYYSGVEQTIDKYFPDVIVLNCCAAAMPAGRLIMDLQDIESVCRKAPDSTIVATHLDSVNHALLSSDDIRTFTAQKHLTQVKIPVNGERVVFSYTAGSDNAANHTAKQS